DERTALEPRNLQRRDHRTDLRVNEIESQLQAVVRHRPGGIRISTDQSGVLRILGVAFSELLTDADGLEVHAEGGRNAALRRPGAVKAGNFVEDRLHLAHVIALNAVETLGRILAGHRIVGIDLRGEEILDTLT